MGVAAEGARVTLFARRVERAEEIAFGAAGIGGSVEAKEWDELGAWRGDAVINCTPVGMSGGAEEGQSPVPVTMLEGWGSGVVVMDTVYRPVETALVGLARGLGNPVILGTEMYMVQARGQVRAWTGLEPGEGVIERFVHKALASPTGG